jgi:mannose-6-phosphate isomerase-like protein (cupin superfamily)
VKACRTASIVGVGALFGAGTIGACREAPQPHVPVVTTAQPPSSTDSTSGGPAADASGTATSLPGPRPVQGPPLQVAIADLPVKLAMASCMEAAIAVVDGTATALGEKLATGDVLLAREGDPFEVTGRGIVVTALRKTNGESCSLKRPVSKDVVPVATTPELTWAKGGMHARLQVGEKQRSDFYLGRLEGSSPVGEHLHKGTWEILASIDAAGTFVLDGKESRLGPRQVVFVPPDTKHEWRPDPGSQLKAVQIYSPHGPEQRFVALAAAEKDAGADAVAPSAKR